MYITGQFTEEQFISGMQRNIPQETLEELLTFEILPNYLKEELHRNLPEVIINLLLYHNA